MAVAAPIAMAGPAETGTTTETKSSSTSQTVKPGDQDQTPESQSDRWKREEVMRRALGRETADDSGKKMMLTVGLPALLILILGGLLRLQE